MSDNETDNLSPLVAEVVAAYVSKNLVEKDDLPALIHQVYQSFLRLGTGGAEGARAGRPEPAVSVKKSVMPEYIVCLEDGKKLKMLKRHLKSTYNLTPDEYRERWGLPTDYPMVAPNYAKHRSRLAKESGLGTKTRMEK
ncbi:MAG: MucR family transcriptional regulator [Proteobacteria bacterium]|nr:MucR family transcriptional regulator [Pseudomonadota bacterium]